MKLTKQFHCNIIIFVDAKMFYGRKVLAIKIKPILQSIETIFVFIHIPIKLDIDLYIHQR